MIDEVSITIVSGCSIGWVSFVVGIDSGIVCGSTIVLSCLGFGCVTVLGSVSGMARLVVCAAAVRVIGGSMCSVCTAVIIVVFICCCGMVAAKQCTGYNNVDNCVGSVMDRASVIACARACCSGVGGSWKGSGWEVHAVGSGSDARNCWSS